ncbi:hypothetical protein F2K64_18165 [Vibrio cholerae]|nr:hypothetical protein [Vibrio cholerae]
MVTNGLTHCDRVCFFAEFAMITALTGWGDHQGEELRSSAQGGQIPIKTSAFGSFINESKRNDKEFCFS